MEDIGNVAVGKLQPHHLRRSRRRRIWRVRVRRLRSYSGRILSNLLLGRRGWHARRNLAETGGGSRQRQDRAAKKSIHRIILDELRMVTDCGRWVNLLRPRKPDRANLA